MPPDPFAGRFTELRLLGKGGFGEVYRALDTAMDAEVALKVLYRDLAADADIRRRFAQEATAARKLNHPNITVVYDRGEYLDQPFIVMELIQGRCLDKLVSDPSLTIGQRIGLLEQLCDGLHYAHQRKILHRDIKPQNLIVREDHDGIRASLTLKIVDFGIAKIVSTEQTCTGRQMFTPEYVSPETILGNELDGRSDMFSVGAVAYELFSGQLAFPITKKQSLFAMIEEVKTKIVDQPHRPLAEVCPWLDSELCAVVDRALQKSPADRFSTLTEMRSALRRVREALERSAPDGSQSTIVLSAAVQEVLRRARRAVQVNDPSTALQLLRSPLDTAPSEQERKLLKEAEAEAENQRSDLKGQAAVGRAPAMQTQAMQSALTPPEVLLRRVETPAPITPPRVIDALRAPGRAAIENPLEISSLPDSVPGASAGEIPMDSTPWASSTASSSMASSEVPASTVRFRHVASVVLAIVILAIGWPAVKLRFGNDTTHDPARVSGPGDIQLPLDSPQQPASRPTFPQPSTPDLKSPAPPPQEGASPKATGPRVSDVREAERLVISANASYQAGAYDEALRQFGEASKLDPGNAAAKIGQSTTRRAKQAEVEIKIAGLLARAKKRFATAIQTLSDYDPVLADLDAILKLRVGHPEAKTLLETVRKAKAWDEARRRK